MKTLLISLICIPLAWASGDSILKTVNPAEPEPKCKSDGQFLLHGGNRCKYVRCAYGTQQAADGTSRLYAVESDCPYGTAVSRATYSHHGLNQATLDERRLCTDRVIRHQNGYRLHDPCSVEAPAFHAYHVYPAKYVIPVKTAKVAAPVKEYGYPVQYGSQYGTYPNGQKAPHPPVAYPAPYPVYPRPYGHVFPAFPAYRAPAGYHGYPGLPAQEEKAEDQEEKADEKQEDEEKAEPEGKQADLPAEVEREPTGGEQGQTSGEEGQRSGEQSQRSGEQESDEEEKEGQGADEGDEQNEVEGEVERVREVKKDQEDERSEQEGGDEED